MEISWTQFKTLIDTNNLRYKYIERTSAYFITGTDGGFKVTCILFKNATDTTDLDDFEANYKLLEVIVPRDANATPLRTLEGATDDTLIGNVGDRLKVDALLSVNDVTVSGGCPTTSSKFRIVHSESSTPVTANYSTMYSYTGSGVLFGFILDYNSDFVRTKLTIDGTEVIFELTNDAIEDMQSFAGAGCDDNDGSADLLGGFIKKTAGNKLNINFHCPIKYDSEVKVEAQRSGSYDKSLERYLVFLTKET